MKEGYVQVQNAHRQLQSKRIRRKTKKCLKGRRILTAKAKIVPTAG